MKVTKENLAEVLQAIYDSEINLEMEWIWKGGFHYVIDNREAVGTGENNLLDGINIMVKDILKKFPESTFAKKYGGVYEESIKGSFDTMMGNPLKEIDKLKNL